MLEFRGVSERGNSRKQVNQDSILMCSNGACGLFVVSDGIGGLASGEVASRKVTAALRNWWDVASSRISSSPITSAADELEDVVLSVNDELLSGTVRCGATIVSLLVINNAYAVVSAGDSRAYMYGTDSELCQISVDDVWEFDTELTRCLTPDEIANSKERGKLTKAVGVEEDLSLNVSTGSIDGKTIFLLMSDGIYKCCPESDLNEIASDVYSKDDIGVGIVKAVSHVYKNGAKDNLSLVIVSFS